MINDKIVYPASKVIINEETILDVTNTTATEKEIAKGFRIVSATGAEIEGTLKTQIFTCKIYNDPAIEDDIEEQVDWFISAEAAKIAIMTNDDLTLRDGDFLILLEYFSKDADNHLIGEPARETYVCYIDDEGNKSWVTIGSTTMCDEYTVTLVDGKVSMFGVTDESIDFSEEHQNDEYIPYLGLDGQGNKKLFWKNSTTLLDKVENIEQFFAENIENLNTLIEIEDKIESVEEASVGRKTTSTGAEIFNDYEHIMALGQYSHAEGVSTSILGNIDYEELLNQGITDETKAQIKEVWEKSQFAAAIGDVSHVEGYDNIALGSYSHVEGYHNIAEKDCSHAEGNCTSASGEGSHSEGYGTVASGPYSHAEGYYAKASGMYSHAEGAYTTASIDYAHAEGNCTTASGYGAHAEGCETIAVGTNQHVQGKYNIEDTAQNYAHIVGNGEDDNNRSNAHTLDWEGNAWFAGDIYVGSASGTNKDTGSKKLATEERVPLQYKITSSLDNTTYAALLATIQTEAGYTNSLVDNTFFNRPPILNERFSFIANTKDDRVVLCYATVTQLNIEEKLKGGGVRYNTGFKIKGVADVDLITDIQEKERAIAAEEALATRVKDIEDNKAGYATKTEAQEYANEVKKAILTGDSTDELKAAYDTLVEIQAWIEGDGVDATELTTAIANETAARQAADEKLSQQLTTAEGHIDDLVLTTQNIDSAIAGHTQAIGSLAQGLDGLGNTLDNNYYSKSEIDNLFQPAAEGPVVRDANGDILVPETPSSANAAISYAYAQDIGIANAIATRPYIRQYTVDTDAERDAQLSALLRGYGDATGEGPYRGDHVKITVTETGLTHLYYYNQTNNRQELPGWIKIAQYDESWSSRYNTIFDYDASTDPKIIYNWAPALGEMATYFGEGLTVVCVDSYGNIKTKPITNFTGTISLIHDTADNVTIKRTDATGAVTLQSYGFSSQSDLCRVGVKNTTRCLVQYQKYIRSY